MNTVNLDELKQLLAQTEPAKRKFAAAQFYRHRLGWLPHPLHGPNDKNVNAKARGKKPRRKGWKTWTANQVTDTLVAEWFADGAEDNVGIVVQAPHCIVDLDSKADNGESVRRWLGRQPHLAAVPRERTAGGAHLHFTCSDLPPITKNGEPYNSALVQELTANVTAEFFFGGQNLVVAPSLHVTGNTYEWEVGGSIPTVKWQELKQWFGFRLPDEAEPAQAHARRHPGRPRKEPPWWVRYRGDLRSVDLVAVVKILGLGAQVIDADQGKHSIECPWRSEHSNSEEPWRASDTSTTIFCKDDGMNFPAFKCLHAHCANRSLEHLLELAERHSPGVVDRNCKFERAWRPNQRSRDGRPRVPLPHIGRPDSVFAAEIGNVLGPKAVWFRKGPFVVMIRDEHEGESSRG